LRAALLTGSSIEVAGYQISPELFRSIDELELVRLMNGVTLPVSWFELVGDAQAGLPMAASNVVNSLNARGCRIEPVAVVGPKFWTTAEITVSDELAKNTLHRLGTS